LEFIIYQLLWKGESEDCLQGCVKDPKEKTIRNEEVVLNSVKVEGLDGSKDEGEDNDDDDNDEGNEEDNGLEDFDQNLNFEQKKQPGGSKGDKSNFTRASPFSTPAGSKNVLDWVSL
jgi:hypothetical protein